MRSCLPKVLHPICGRPLVEHVLHTTTAIGAAQTVLVLSEDTIDPVRERFGSSYQYVVQAPQLGTGHAVQQAQPVLEGAVERVLVLYGADPLMRLASVEALLAELDRPGVVAAITTFVSEPPTGYGRIVRDGTGQVMAIVEERDATPEQRLITEVNQGVAAYDAAWLWSHLNRLQPSPIKGEYYLTDLVAMAIAEGGPGSVAAFKLADPTEAWGVNDRYDLSQAEGVLRQRILRNLMSAGVTITDPSHTYVDAGVVVGQDSVLLPGTMLKGKTVIGERCTIGPNSVLEDATIGDDCQVKASFVEQAIMENGSNVGPLSHLRPGARLGADVHVGNFAEVNRSSLGPNTKMGHFSYMGDAEVGADVNIGAGTITANFGDKRVAPDKRKHQTVIGDGVKIGSDTMLVAPVHIGPGARTGAGSVVTKDVGAGETVVGVPARPLGPKPDDGQGT
jgi:bifunctional UDP-N-acetylglucosamine pyrophosphorylase/glucosamine-1-phosphate N-acetyltransferase